MSHQHYFVTPFKALHGATKWAPLSPRIYSSVVQLVIMVSTQSASPGSNPGENTSENSVCKFNHHAGQCACFQLLPYVCFQVRSQAQLKHSLTLQKLVCVWLMQSIDLPLCPDTTFPNRAYALRSRIIVTVPCVPTMVPSRTGDLQSLMYCIGMCTNHLTVRRQGTQGSCM